MAIKTINKTQIVGLLKDMSNLSVAEKKVKLTLSNGETKEVTCKQISKKVLRNPSFVVAVEKIDANGNTSINEIGVDFFPISEYKVGENDKIITNPRFTAMETVLATYVPNETRVKIDGTLIENGYVGQDFTYKSFPQINGFSITSSNVPENDSSDCEISGVIHSMDYELDKNEQKTGRLIVTMDCFDNSEATYPIKFVVEEDLADDVANFYELGQTTKLCYEIITKTVGEKRTSENKGFGRRDSNIVSGFSIVEFSIFSGDEPFVEESDYYIPIEKVTEALEAREIMKEKKIKEKQEESTSAPKTASPRGASANGSSPFGNASNASSAPKKKNPFEK